MLKIGLTGGIGSGKSSICSLFRRLGAPTFDADVSAKEARNVPEVQVYLSEKYGNSILTDGVYDNKKLGDIIFNDKEKLAELTNMISTYVVKDYEKFCEKNKAKPYTIFESAILFERGLGYLFDKIICVIADKEIRIRRVMKRNNFTREEVLARMDNQLSNEEILNLGDCFIINNDECAIDPVGAPFNEYLSEDVIRIDNQFKTYVNSSILH